MNLKYSVYTIADTPYVLFTKRDLKSMRKELDKNDPRDVRLIEFLKAFEAEIKDEVSH